MTTAPSSDTPALTTTMKVTTTTTTQKHVTTPLSILIDYPALVNQEEQMVKTPYDVAGWTLYLDLLDDLLATIQDKTFAGAKNQEKLVTLGGRTNVRVGNHASLTRELVAVRIFVGQRAVQLLPGSYKLWRNHLVFQVEKLGSKKKYFAMIIESFEDCLKRLHKMPRLWIDYLEYIQNVRGVYTNITQWRRLVNRALTSLPVTQHVKVWAVVLQVLEHDGTDSKSVLPSETVVRMLRRYCLLEPTYRSTFAKLCISDALKRPAEAALLHLELLNDATTPSFQKYDLWMTFSDLVCQHAYDCRRVGIDFEALVRGALTIDDSMNAIVEMDELKEDQGGQSNAQQESHLTKLDLGEMEGTLWAKLANYFTRLGNFDMARSVYEEAMDAVSRVRDFSILFDAYSQLEEGILEIAMGEMNEEDEDAMEEEENTAPDNGDNDDLDILLGDQAPNKASNDNNKTNIDMEWALSRAEHLTARRPLLLNRVLLKQNPHNVGEWLTRAQLYQKQEQLNMAIATLHESLKRVQASKAVNGSPSQLVLELVRLYEEEQKDVDKAREVLQQICQDGVGAYRFRHVEDLATCHAAFIELELRHEHWDEALSLARQSVAPPNPSSLRENGPLAAKLAKALPKSLRLWDLLLDLEESLGTVATTKDSYNRAMEIKVATPMHILNFCNFLKDKTYFEESFNAYERGVELFQFPGGKVLWKNYLENFIERYQGTKVERVRDLFERCLESCPEEDCSEFFLMNGDFEEEFGLTKRALGVYKAMCHKVPDAEKFTAYQLYIAKTTKYLGVTATRDVYQEAIAALKDDEATAKICLDFSKMESSLQEIDRARGILTYGAQMADPRRNPEYWTTWHDFEVSHGNEETFREMLRIKRSVQASFSTVNYNATDMGTSLENMDPEQALEMIANQEGVDLDAHPSLKQQGTIEGFVQQKRNATTAGLGDVEERVAKLRKAAAASEEAPQDDEIDIDDLDDDEEEEEEAAPVAAAAAKIHNVSTKQVPTAVFGGLAAAAATKDAAKK